MEASNVLVVRVPRPIEDMDACLEHIKRGLHDGILILGMNVSYAVEKFPPLGAVEVVGEPVPSAPAEPIVSPPRKPRKAKRVPESGTAKKEQPLQMAEADIVASYRQAANPDAQIGILADLNLCSKDRILAILQGAGVELPAKKNGPDSRERSA